MSFHCREYLSQEEVDEIYEMEDGNNCFSIKYHHGGRFTKFPGRKYVEGKVQYVDLLNVDYFCVHVLDEILEELGYDKADQPRYYHYLVPGEDLDFGIRALGGDDDVRLFLSHIPSVRTMYVYVELFSSKVGTYFITPSKVKIEEIKDEELKCESVQVKKPSTRLALEWVSDPIANPSVVYSAEQPSGSTSGNPLVINVDDQLTLDDPFFDDIFNQEPQNPDVDFQASLDQLDLDLNELPSNWTNYVIESLGEDTDEDHLAQSAVLEDDNSEEGCVTEKTGSGSSDGCDTEEDSDFDVDVGNALDDVDMSDYLVDVEQLDEIDPVEVNFELNNQELPSGSDSDDGGTSFKKRTLKYLKDQSDKDSIFYVGQVFATKAEVKETVREHSVKSRRQLKIIKDDRCRLRAVCHGDILTFDSCTSAMGSTSSKKGKERMIEKNVGGRGKKTNPDEYLCPWALLVSQDVQSGSWLVKTFNLEHKCMQSRCIKACTANFLSKKLVDQVAANPNIPIKSLQEQFQREYEVNVSMMKAFRAKSAAMVKVDGDYTTQYALLRDYVEELVRANPGTTVKIEVEPCANPSSSVRQFRRIYICIGGLKEGFKATGRDLLGLDGAFIKGPYPGQVLSAVGVDPNNGIYPVAYALVEAENMNSWTWFLECLRDDLELESNSRFTFITDRQKGVIQAIAKLFPVAEHRYCLRHIHENMKQSFRGKVYKDALWNLATCNTPIKFDKAMSELRSLNRKAFEWLSKIPPKHWARSHFSGRAVSDVLLNNMCEVFNSKIMVGRDKPIVTLLEYIREYLMRRIVNVLAVIDNCETILTPYATKIFEVVKRDASKYTITWNGEDHYQANGPSGDQVVVNMRDKSCACMRWAVSGIPCRHAVAAIRMKAAHGETIGSPESFVHPIYRLETWKAVYKHKIYPVNGQELWQKSKVPTTLVPPKYHKPVGRPKKARKKSAFEVEDATRSGKLTRRGGTTTCGKCGKRGHNSRSCKGQEDQ